MNLYLIDTSDDIIQRRIKEFCLSQWMLEHCGDIKKDQFDFSLIKRTRFGKPYIYNSPCNFNVSHHGSYSAIGISNEYIVGVDVVRTTNDDMEMESLLNYFGDCIHEEERKYILAHDKSIQDYIFNIFWSLKESYLKATGWGLSDNMESTIYFVVNNGVILGNNTFYDNYQNLEKLRIDECLNTSICKHPHKRMIPTLSKLDIEIEVFQDGIPIDWFFACYRIDSDHFVTIAYSPIGPRSLSFCETDFKDAFAFKNVNT